MRASTVMLAMTFSALVIALSGGDPSVAIGLTGIFASAIVMIHRFAGFGAMLVPLAVSLLHTVTGEASSVVYALVYSLFALMAYRVAHDHKACLQNRVEQADRDVGQEPGNRTSGDKETPSLYERRGSALVFSLPPVNRRALVPLKRERPRQYSDEHISVPVIITTDLSDSSAHLAASDAGPTDTGAPWGAHRRGHDPAYAGDR